MVSERRSSHVKTPAVDRISPLGGVPILAWCGEGKALLLAAGAVPALSFDVLSSVAGVHTKPRLTCRMILKSFDSSRLKEFKAGLHASSVISIFLS